jgi:hypothetical protein
MVLEHLHHPVRALQLLHEWASPGARLVMSVPNGASYEARLFGDAWYALQLPTHLFHYTPDTLGKVLRAGGWNLERVLHQRVVTNLAVSVGYRLNDWHPDSGVARWLQSFPAKGRWQYAAFPLAAALARIGQTGRMTVWASRAHKLPAPRPDS